MISKRKDSTLACTFMLGGMLGNISPRYNTDINGSMVRLMMMYLYSVISVPGVSERTGADGNSDMDWVPSI